LECRSRALKVLDYALSGSFSGEDCVTFVQASGLKWLFNILAGSTGSSKINNQAMTELLGNCLGILVSLFTNVESESPERIRLLSKFVESDYSCIDRLLEIRESATRKLNFFDKDIENKRKVIQRLYVPSVVM
jgi:beta-catenin-like protein 1